VLGSTGGHIILHETNSFNSCTGIRKDEAPRGVCFLLQNWWHSKFLVKVLAGYLASAGGIVTLVNKPDLKKATTEGTILSTDSMTMKDND
jgi:hypothetical protein